MEERQRPHFARLSFLNPQKSSSSPLSSILTLGPATLGAVTLEFSPIFVAKSKVFTYISSFRLFTRVSSKICLHPNFGEDATVTVAIQRLDLFIANPLLPASKPIIVVDGTAPQFCGDASYFKFPWLAVQSHEELFESPDRSHSLVSLCPHML